MTDYADLINAAANILAEKDIAIERERADKWMESGRRYDDIRDWLRVCQNTPEGHAEFYNECSRIIFGEPVD